MHADNEETKNTGPSRRKMIGRMVFFIGLSLLLVVIVFSLSVSIVSSYSGTQIPASNYSSIIPLLFILGLILIVAGLTAIILPDGLSRDGVWAMKLGPFIRAFDILQKD
jgi:hypothetical protein